MSDERGCRTPIILILGIILLAPGLCVLLLGGNWNNVSKTNSAWWDELVSVLLRAFLPSGRTFLTPAISSTIIALFVLIAMSVGYWFLDRRILAQGNDRFGKYRTATILAFWLILLAVGFVMFLTVGSKMIPIIVTSAFALLIIGYLLWG